jgi:hypothetical protein
MQQRCCHQSDPLGAEAALQSSLVMECLPNGAELPILHQPLSSETSFVGAIVRVLSMSSRSRMEADQGDSFRRPLHNRR